MVICDICNRQRDPHQWNVAIARVTICEIDEQGLRKLSKEQAVDVCRLHLHGLTSKLDKATEVENG